MGTTDTLLTPRREEMKGEKMKGDEMNGEEMKGEVTH